MYFVKTTQEGQLTIPDAIRQKLGIQNGDKVAFEEEDGKIVLLNPTVAAFREVQKAFEGEAERLGLKDMDDVVAMIKEVRKEIADEQAQNHD